LNLDDSSKRGLTTRVGVISPDDAVNDDEYYTYLPPGVTLLWTRYRTPQRFEPISVAMVASYGDLDVVREAALTLRITRPHATLFSCNSCSFVHGPAGDQRIRDVIAEAVGSEATSITEAQVHALRTLKVKRVAVGAPYCADVTAKLVSYLESSGFTVSGSLSLGLTTEWEIGNSASTVWAHLARQVDSEDADGILLACSGIRTAGILDSLEKELQKPILSATAVSMWRVLRLAGVHGSVKGHGVLLERY
jgi:maleate isomerase